jgi:hypothetical protein
LIIPNFHGGVIKYDPVLREATINVSRVVEIISARVEEMLPRYIDSHGSPTGNRLDWLVRFRGYALDNLDPNIFEALDKAKKVYRELSHAVHSVRTVAANDVRAEELAQEQGAADEDFARRSASSQQIRAITNAGLIQAEGQPYSDERRDQFEGALALWKLLVSMGTLEVSPQKPPRLIAHDDDDWRQWWLKKPEGHQLELSAWSSNGHPMRNATAQQKLEYGRANSGRTRRKLNCSGHQPRPLRKRSRKWNDPIIWI